MAIFVRWLQPETIVLMLPLPPEAEPEAGSPHRSSVHGANGIGVLRGSTNCFGQVVAPVRLRPLERSLGVPPAPRRRAQADDEEAITSKRRRGRSGLTNTDVDGDVAHPTDDDEPRRTPAPRGGPVRHPVGFVVTVL